MAKSEDPGLWLVNGKVQSNKVRLAVWAAFDAEATALAAEYRKLEARHRKELAALHTKSLALQKRRPLTPWVGRADTGAVPQFVEEAKRSVAAHKRVMAGMEAE